MDPTSLKKSPDDWLSAANAKALCLADSLIVHGKVDGSDVRLRRWAPAKTKCVCRDVAPNPNYSESFEVDSIRNIHKVL